MKYQLLLSIFAITLSQAAVIPQHGDHANEQSLTSLDSEAAALLNEDMFGMNDQQNDNDDDPLIDDIEVNDELQHEDGDEHQDIIEDTTYTLDQFGRFVPVSTATQDAIDFEENNQPDDMDVDHNDPGMHMIVDSTMATSNEPVVHGGEEDGDEIGDEVYIFEDDEDTLDQKLEIDPETGMPFFKNKYEADFDHHIQWAAQINDEFNDDDDSQQLAQHQYHPATLPFCPMDWRVILLGLIIIAVIIRFVWRKNLMNSNDGAISLPISSKNEWRKPPMSRKYHGKPRMLSVHGHQDFMITPPARKSPLRDAHASTPTTTVVLPIQDDVSVKSFHRGGHMRRASAGAPHQVMGSRQNHARHSSMSGIHHM